MKYIRAIIKSARPIQWTKNIFVFAGLIFSREFTNVDKILISLETFGMFCLLASGIYIFNDIIDLPQDRVHPQKRNRPLASGELPVVLAWVFSVLMAFCGVFWAFSINNAVGVVGVSYLFFQVLYTLFLKHLVIVDILVVSSGFLLRAASGTFAVGVDISQWLILCTSFLALFLVTAKRRQELYRIECEGAEVSRPVMLQYSLSFIDELLVVEAGATITAYALYVFSPDTAIRSGTRFLGLTLPFVIYGIFRYVYLVKVLGKGEAPERIVITDLPLVADFVMWVITVVVLLYFRP